jgi:hypothetical protein
VARVSVSIALVTVCAFLGACGGGGERGDSSGPVGPSPRKQFEAALLKTRHAGSAAVVERVVSEPRDLQFEVTGRTRFDYNDALLKVRYARHRSLAPGSAFHVRIADFPYVRRTNGRWYVPPYHSGEFELGYSNFLHLVSRAYGEVESEGPRTLLVRMSRDNLERLRTSAEGSLGPLGTMYDLLGPMRFELDDEGRIGRIEYTVTGRYYFSLTPAHEVSVTTEFTDFASKFDVEPPPGDMITPGPLKPPRPAAATVGNSS